MLAQVFGSTVNSQTLNNFFATTVSNAIAQAIINQNSYTVLVAESQLTISNVGLTAIFASVASKAFSVSMRNVSTGGQTIRIGLAPSYAGGLEAGMILNVNDVWLIDGFDVSLNAIASGAGALLAVFVMRTA